MSSFSFANVSSIDATQECKRAVPYMVKKNLLSLMAQEKIEILIFVPEALTACDAIH